MLALLITAATVGLAFAAEQASGSAHGTKVSLTWDDAIRAALQGHPLIKQFEHELLETEAGTKQLEAILYPRVTAAFVNTGGNTRVLANLGVSGSLPKPTNYLTTPGIRVDYLITDFGYSAHKILANKALAASSKNNVLTTRALVILNVQQAYLNCLKQQRRAAIAREIQSERRFIRDQAAALHRHDLRSKLDLEFADVELARADVAVIRADNDVAAAFANLQYALGRRGAGDYRLETLRLPTQAPETPDVEPLVAQAMERRPELLGSKDREQAAQEVVKAARALYFGAVTAIGTAGYTWWAHEERPSGKEVSNPGAQLGFWGVGVTSSFPLYTGGRIEGQVEEAEARNNVAKAETRILANDILLEVVRAYVTRLTAGQLTTVALERASHAREALTLARERYKAGLGSILEVTQATADVLEAENGLADAQYELQGSEFALGYATGSEYPKW